MKTQTLELFLRAIEALNAKVAVLEARAVPDPDGVPLARSILAGVLDSTGHRDAWEAWEADELDADQHTELLHLVRIEGRRWFRDRAERLLDEIAAEAKALFGSAKDKVGAFFAGARRYVKELFAAGILAFAGNSPMVAAELEALNQQVAVQSAYLKTFESEIVRENKPLDGTFVARAEQYGSSAWGAVQEILRRGVGADHSYSHERRIHQGKDEPCPVCVEEIAKGWQPIGTLRKIGDSPCRCNCHCIFIYGEPGDAAKAFGLEGKKYTPCRDARGRFASCGSAGGAGAAKPAGDGKPAVAGGGKKPKKKPGKPKPGVKPSEKPKPGQEKPTAAKPGAKPAPAKPAAEKPTAAPAAKPPAPPKPAKEKPAAKPKPEKPAKPEYHKDGFPKKLDHLEKVKDLGGSTGAVLMRDPHTGKQFVQKQGASAEHLWNEHHADNAYRALGVDVAASRIYTAGGKPTKLAEHIEGKSLGDLAKSDPKAFLAAREQASKGFAADALLGNWDVVGMHHDNILVTAAGRVVRIDNGGALNYRAQGAKKTAAQWNGKVDELDSMRNPAVNPSAAGVFHGLSDADIRGQAKALLGKKDAMLAAIPKDQHAVLDARFKALEKVASGQPATAVKAPTLTPKMESWTAKPDATFQKFDTVKGMEEWGYKHYGDWSKGLTLAETQSLKLYSGNLFPAMNGHLRGTKTEAQLGMGLSKAGVEKYISDATSALTKAKTAEDIVGYRGIKNFEDMGFKSLADFKPGHEFTEKGFSSVTLDKTKAVHFAHDIGESIKSQVVFHINVPKGSTGGYLNAGELSDYSSERELLFPPSAKYRVVGHGKPIKRLEAEIPVVILERVH